MFAGGNQSSHEIPALMSYPVLEILDELRQTLHTAPITILQAPPGAGKSTVLPLKLMDEPWITGKKIIMLEPRRLAARSVAERMADVLNEEAGGQIGYRVRFDTRVSARTKVEVVTEGILTRMLQSDPTLEEAALIVFDEFHERSLHADLALALCLQVQQLLRPDLKILIMSATLDGATLSSLLGNAPVVTSQGRQFPVTLKYAAQDSDEHISARVTSAIRRAMAEEEGDVLVFLPGVGEIKRVFDNLQNESINAVVHPLYGDLTFRKQQEAILPRKDGVRKIVLATSIAETSLTIEGVKVVIDSGLSRVPRFDPRSGLTRLETTKVTRDSADQRAGRAGRLGPGVCYRLWTQGANLFLVDQRKPEIQEADLAPMLLELAQWGVHNVNDLTWVTPPPAGAVSQARDLLVQLEALDEGITARGKKMLQLPTHPRLAHLLLIAQEENKPAFLALATDVAALLEERDPLDRNAGADLTLRVEVIRKWRTGERVAAERNVLERIEKLAANWRRILKVQVDNSAPVDTEIGRLLWGAYPERIAQQQGKHVARFKLGNGRMVSLGSHDPLIREQWICVAHLDAGSGEGKVFLAAPLHPDDLREHALEKTNVRWDDGRGMMVATRERRIGPLIFESRPVAVSDDEKRLAVIFAHIRDKGLRILGDPVAREELQARILSLHKWRPDESWPPVSDEYLLATMEAWLTPFLNDVTKETELNRLDIHAIVCSILPWDKQQVLDKLAPVRIAVPSGSMIKVNYNKEGSPPVVEVRLQEMFGLSQTPEVNEGRTKVLLHLLSPGYKPVQVTQDLKSFWETTYHEVRKELRMRYPRHHWPEDPWTAEAVRGARRRTQ
jgi:ATP-dependent helicase HrpB